MPMTLKSVNVGRPAAVAHAHASVLTGIFKQPVAGPVRVGKLNLDGDGQADLIHHGGASKAVYAYSLDHYAWWRTKLARDDLTFGQFGENLTVVGLDEAQLCIGDQLRIGSALFTISQPRVPCFKLGIRFGDVHMPRLFAESLRTGVYLRVLREGLLEAGDAVEVVALGKGSIAIRSLFEAYFKPDHPAARALLTRALEVPELSAEWHGHITRRLAIGQRERDG